MTGAFEASTPAGTVGRVSNPALVNRLKARVATEPDDASNTRTGMVAGDGGVPVRTFPTLPSGKPSRRRLNRTLAWDCILTMSSVPAGVCTVAYGLPGTARKSTAPVLMP